MDMKGLVGGLKYFCPLLAHKNVHRGGWKQHNYVCVVFECHLTHFKNLISLYASLGMKLLKFILFSEKIPWNYVNSLSLQKERQEYYVSMKFVRSLCQHTLLGQVQFITTVRHIKIYVSLSHMNEKKYFFVTMVISFISF